MATSSRLSSPAPNINSGGECSKGGAVAPKSAKQSKALEVENGLWIWDGVVNVLEVDLFSPAWEVRHGAAMALRELLKLQGKCGGMRGKYYGNEFLLLVSLLFVRQLLT
jgi:TATA-binding protein-associated factor